MKSVVVRDYDGYRMVSRELIKSMIRPWHLRVQLTGEQLIHFVRSAINRSAISDNMSMAVLKSAIRYYNNMLMELL